MNRRKFFGGRPDALCQEHRVIHELVEFKFGGITILPRAICNTKYYSLIEVCRAAGISRSTLLRWMKEKSVDDTFRRDSRGWRVFNEADLKRIKKEADKIQSERSIVI